MSKTQKIFKEATTTALMVLGVLSFRYSIAEAYIVPTGSMEPTIIPGDRLFVNKAAYDFKIPFTDIVLGQKADPKRGEVIVFKYPPDPSIFYIKRLIGLPGDQIEVKDGFISVNGHPLKISTHETEKLMTLNPKELRANFYWETVGNVSHAVQRLPHSKTQETLEFKVPENSYFFMGDNRDNSSDSRAWGFVPRSYLKGKALAVWLSLDSSHGIIPTVRWNRSGQPL